MIRVEAVALGSLWRGCGYPRSMSAPDAYWLFVWNSANVASIALLAPADHPRQYKRTISEGLVTCS